MNRFRRIIAHLSCQIRECIHNSNGVCNSCDPPEIHLFTDGSFECKLKKEKTYSLELTDKEIRYIGDTLSRQSCNGLISSQSIPVINRILRKIEQHIYPEWFVR